MSAPYLTTTGLLLVRILASNPREALGQEVREDARHLVVLVQVAKVRNGLELLAVGFVEPKALHQSGLCRG